MKIRRAAIARLFPSITAPAPVAKQQQQKMGEERKRGQKMGETSTGQAPVRSILLGHHRRRGEGKRRGTRRHHDPGLLFLGDVREKHGSQGAYHWTTTSREIRGRKRQNTRAERGSGGRFCDGVARFLCCVVGGSSLWARVCWRIIYCSEQKSTRRRRTWRWRQEKRSRERGRGGSSPSNPEREATARAKRKQRI